LILGARAILARQATARTSLGIAPPGGRPPRDDIDGAARILDPAFSGRLTGTFVWGISGTTTSRPRLYTLMFGQDVR